MQAGEWIYEVAMRLAVPATSLAAPFSAKLRRGVAGRAASLQSMSEWAATARDPARPLVWLHAPSVGEALMAQAIRAELQRRLPDLQSAFTFFSPSAERMAARVGADWHGYLPWDTRAAARTALRALRPDCIAFVRTEIWPALVREAVASGVTCVLVNGVLAAGSSRTRPGARLLLGPAYARLAAVGAVSDVDAASFPRLGVPISRITVTGDARFDQVWRRVQALDTDRPLLRPFRNQARPWIVAGSTWPADEERLLQLLSGHRGGWRMIIAPHEPTAAHVAALERRLADAGISHTRLHSDNDAPHKVEADVVVVDRVGVLADLYAVADAAYVGGGFGNAGLHSVVEPAALAVPVVYGPRHGNAQEARRLAEAGGGFVVDDTTSLEACFERLRTDLVYRQAAGEAARDFVRSHLGGAAGSADLIVAGTRLS